MNALRKRILALIETHGSQKNAAAALGMSAQYLSDVLRGRRTPGPKILKALGLTAVTEYK